MMFLRLISISFCLLFFASCNQVKLSDARDEYVRGDYYAASETYRKLFRETTNKENAYRGVIAYEMAEVNRKINRTSRALSGYRNAIRHGYPDTLMYLRYAQMLHREGEYRQAIDAYREFLKFKPNNSLAINGKTGAEMSLFWQDNSTGRFIIKPVELFNSNQSEFSPMLAQNDNVLYFTSSRKDATGEVVSPISGMKYNDLFTVEKNAAGEWQKPVILSSDINTEFDEGTPSITSNGRYMFYTYCSANYNKPASPKIYYSRRVNGKWTAGREFVIETDDSLSVFAHPAVSPSGEYLYFVSDMPGGYGGKDIWRAELTLNFDVVAIENAGPVINSAGDEMFPYVRNDSTIYFSSDGHPGMGGFDIFEAKLLSDNKEWRIMNMESPINSSYDDFGITFEKLADRGFFSSNRDDIRGYDHIYSFDSLLNSINVEGIVVDSDDEFIANATLSVVGNDGSQYKFKTSKNGEYNFKANSGIEYLIMASAEGFLNQSKSFEIGSEVIDTLYYIDFEMIPYNKPVVLENIFYDFDSSSLREESKKDLNGLIELLEEHPEIRIELMSHTDRNGSEGYNIGLSLQRAESVANYLFNNGIDKGRVVAIGLGKSEPKRITESLAKRYSFINEDDVLTESFINELSSEQQEIADQLNRRTEFKVIGFKN